jgi:hypothetical protein
MVNYYHQIYWNSNTHLNYFRSNFPLWAANIFRRTLSLDIISSQINDLKPIPFCLNYGELLPSNLLKFKYTLKQNFPLKWSRDRSVYSHEMRYFIDELSDEVMSVYNIINACCLTKQSINLVCTINSITENVNLVSFFVVVVVENNSYAV